MLAALIASCDSSFIPVSAVSMPSCSVLSIKSWASCFLFATVSQSLTSLDDSSAALGSAPNWSTPSASLVVIWAGFSVDGVSSLPSSPYFACSYVQPTGMSNGRLATP